MHDRPGPSLLFDFFGAAQQVRLLLGDAMADCGLRPDEYAVYSVLVDAGSSSPTRMAELTGIPPTTMSHHVRTMLERGHVRRRRNSADGRSSLLSLTGAGLAAHGRAAAAFEEANQRFLAGLGVSVPDAREVLAAIRSAAEDAGRDLARSSMRAAG